MTDRPTKGPTNQPTDRRADRVIGMGHLQKYLLSAYASTGYPAECINTFKYNNVHDYPNVSMKIYSTAQTMELEI